MFATQQQNGPSKGPLMQQRSDCPKRVNQKPLENPKTKPGLPAERCAVMSV
jgi:hypothetical protein